MARPSIASLCPPARRGTGGKPARRARHRDVPLRDLHGKGAKRRIVRHPGVLSFGDFSLREQRKVTQGAGAEPPAIRF